MDEANDSPRFSDAAALPPAQPWIRPEVVRMRAGDAEAGSNPLRPEGPIATGS